MFKQEKDSTDQHISSQNASESTKLHCLHGYHFQGRNLASYTERTIELVVNIGKLGYGDNWKRPADLDTTTS